MTTAEMACMQSLFDLLLEQQLDPGELYYQSFLLCWHQMDLSAFSFSFFSPSPAPFGHIGKNPAYFLGLRNSPLCECFDSSWICEGRYYQTTSCASFESTQLLLAQGEGINRVLPVISVGSPILYGASSVEYTRQLLL